MAKKNAKKTNGIQIGGDANNTNIVQGDNNVINLPSQYVKINSLHQLPSALADFTGREDLLKEILQDFETSKGATISGLTGLGGIGKTALGLQVAHQIKDKYPDAQIFLDLKGTTTPLTALDIARHVILSFEPSADLRGLDENNMQGAYQSVLDGKRVLLYFDNARSAEQIAKLIPPKSCALIVTSRWTFPVTGLKAYKVGALDEKEAKEFLLELCARIADHADELAKACGYLPLALRIAGSYLQVNSNSAAEKYLAELASVKNRLETFTKSREQAELTSEPDVFATFELSYAHLDENKQKMWRMLGVFPAPFDSIAASAMWEIEDIKTTDENLSLLMRYSLIDFNQTSARYELHDLLAEFAREKMGSREEEEAYIRHAVHYSNVLGYLQGMFKKGGENLMVSLRQYDLEWIHIKFGQLSAVKHLEKSTDAAKACNWYAWQGSINGLRLKSKTNILWLKDGLKASKLLNNKKAEGAHLGNLGAAYAALREFKTAIEFHKQDLIIAREIKDRYGEGAVLVNLGIAYRNLGEFKKAIEYYEETLKIVREIDNRHGEGIALANLGSAHLELKKPEKAIEVYNQALLVVREIGDKPSEGIVLGNLGNAYYLLGETSKTIEFYEQALVIVQEIGDKLNTGNWLVNLGSTFYGLGEKEKGIELVNQALSIFEAIESPNAELARNKLKEWGVLK